MTSRARRAAAGLAVIAVGATLASCARGHDDGRSVDVRGAALVTEGGERSRLGTGRHRVPTGAVLRVTSGTAMLDLVGDATAELRAATAGAPDSSLRVADVPTLLLGEALVVSADRARLGAGDVVVTVEAGAARIRQLSSTTVGTYTGVARVDARGRPVRVQALRQLTVAGSEVPRRPSPLVYDQQSPDAWDSRYLGAAIDIGQQLDRRSAALTAQLIQPRPTATYLAGLLPALGRQPGFGDDLLPATAVGETLVGASIALGARPRNFVAGWRGVFDFRAEGARWGLVALDQRARRGEVVAGLDAVLGRVTLRFAGPSASATRTSPTTAPRRSGGGRTTPSTSPPTTQPPGPTPTLPTLTVPRLSTPITMAPGATGSTGNPPPPTTSPPTTLPPTPPSSVPPVTVPPTLAPVVKPIEDILGGILGK